VYFEVQEMPVALLAPVEITFNVSYGLSDVSDIVRVGANALDTESGVK